MNEQTLFPAIDRLATVVPVDFGPVSSNTEDPHWASRAWREQAGRWQIVRDVREGTLALREKSATYLPRFEAETAADHAARLRMTFHEDHYDTTLLEHVGLLTARAPELGDDVPERLVTLMEDIDGEGNHLDVFIASALEAALHWGHCLLLTDKPATAGLVRTLAEERRLGVRPYVTLYPAPDILAVRLEVVGGTRVVTRVMLRERGEREAGAYGLESFVGLRELRQEVARDALGRATALGAITWRTWRQATGANAGSPAFLPLASGVVTAGPPVLAARFIYGGQRVGPGQSVPHLWSLALASIEQTQLKSDYARVMHLCNVPTPVFIGRQKDPSGGTIQLGQGLDIPLGGDAMMLEPTGAALSSTQQRLEDLRVQMRRQGATSADPTGKVLTATEAALYARQRNAKLARAARSAQDALEGVLMDLAAFERLPEGGSITLDQDFTVEGLDPQLLAVYLTAYEKDALPLDAVLHALKHGKLPDEWDTEALALEMLAGAEARAEVMAGNPYEVVAAGGEFMVRKVAGHKVMGHHATRAAAVAQFRALEAAAARE